jgi:hypothetical protein
MLWKHCDSQTKNNCLLGTLNAKTKIPSVSRNLKTSQTENVKEN